MKSCSPSAILFFFFILLCFFWVVEYVVIGSDVVLPAFVVELLSALERDHADAYFLVEAADVVPQDFCHLDAVQDLEMQGLLLDSPFRCKTYHQLFLFTQSSSPPYTFPWFLRSTFGSAFTYMTSGCTCTG
uniref:Uncharacterized protein n=1 Tax=Rhipicephalus zambeziensis TaxID=60191 RepID=A0A224YFS8_9ACAR